MTHQEFEECVNEIARKKVQLNAINAEREQKIAAINESVKEDVDSLTREIKALTAKCLPHAKEHRTEIFGTEKKSAETPLALFSLCINPPSLKPYSSATWTKVFELVKEKERYEYIAHVPELNREKLKTDMINKEWTKDPELRVRIVHEESFNVVPKKK